MSRRPRLRRRRFGRFRSGTRTQFRLENARGSVPELTTSHDLDHGARRSLVAIGTYAAGHPLVGANHHTVTDVLTMTAGAVACWFVRLARHPLPGYLRW